MKSKKKKKKEGGIADLSLCFFHFKKFFFFLSRGVRNVTSF